MSVILVVVTDNGENFASLTYIITQHYTVYRALSQGPPVCKAGDFTTFLGDKAVALSPHSRTDV